MSRIWAGIVRLALPPLATASRPPPRLRSLPCRRGAHSDSDFPFVFPPKLLASQLKGYLKLVGAKQGGSKPELRARLAAILSHDGDAVTERFAAAGLKRTRGADIEVELTSARERLLRALTDDGLCEAGGEEGLVVALQAPEEVVVDEPSPPRTVSGSISVPGGAWGPDGAAAAEGQLTGLRGGKRKKMVERLLWTQMLSLYRRCLRSAERCPSQDWADTMLHYVRMRFREGSVSPGNLAITLSAGELELANMNILHAQREAKEAEDANKEWRR